MIPLWSAPYAVAHRNCIIIKKKTSSEFPEPDELAELAEEAGSRRGVWNVVKWREEPWSTECWSIRILQGSRLLGPPPTGRDVIYKKCGETGKRVIAQCGAKNSMGIMPDCNIQATFPSLMTSFFGNAGQRCLQALNLIVVGDDDQF